MMYPSGLASSQEKITNPLEEVSEAFEALATRVNPTVVQIFATAYVPGRGLVPSAGLLATRKSAGSGVLVDPEGYIITNAHVVAGARRVQIMLAPRADEQPDGQSILQPQGRLRGQHHHQRTRRRRRPLSADHAGPARR